jgi:hypothetical protein
LSAFRIGLFLLLAANALYFVMSGSASKAVDSCAWLALLALFEAETGFRGRLAAARRQRGVRAARLIAAAGVVSATIGYVFEDNRLDAANSVLWILVVVVLEAQFRAPAFAARHRWAVNGVAATLYGGLGLLVIVWAAHGLWFDAYDAILWLVAFATIELAVARRVSVA